MKKIYIVGVYEIWEQMYEVEAESESEAIEKIENGEAIPLEDQFCFVELDPDNTYNFYEKDISVNRGAANELQE